jgi:hypothetical protein
LIATFVKDEMKHSKTIAFVTFFYSLFATKYFSRKNVK